MSRACGRTIARKIPFNPQYPCRRPQHIQSSTPPRLPGHDAELPSRSCGAVARCRRSMKPDLTLPPLGSSIVAVTRPDHQLEFGRLLDRQIGRLLALEDPAGIIAGLSIQGGDARAITNQATCLDGKK